MYGHACVFALFAPRTATHRTVGHAPRTPPLGQRTRRCAKHAALSVAAYPCPSQDLGAAALSKRPTSYLLVLPKPIKGGDGDEAEAKEFAEAYTEVEKKVKSAQILF